MRQSLHQIRLECAWSQDRSDRRRFSQAQDADWLTYTGALLVLLLAAFTILLLAGVIT